jgi:formate/nitrite transporter FocA (FNT family)
MAVFFNVIYLNAREVKKRYYIWLINLKNQSIIMENEKMSLGTPPDNNLVWAILCTVMCCLPLGIVSIIKSAKVKELWAMGDHEGAQKAADDAKKYAIWGAVAGLVVGIIYGVFIVVLGASGSY